MIDVTIPESILDGLGLTPEALYVRMGRLAWLGRTRWIQLAQQRLRSSSGEYIRGIQPEQVEPGMGSEYPSARLGLSGGFPNMVEQGQGPYDLRSTLLFGPNVKLTPRGTPGVHVSKKGDRYRSIPFRTMMSGTGRNAQVVGTAYGRHGFDAGFVKGLQQQVRSAAKNLAPSVEGPGGRTKWGGALSSWAAGATMLKAHHTAPIHAGMYKIQKAYDNATQNTYMSFRTISSKEPEPGDIAGALRRAVSWMHPGITGRHLLDDVADYVRQVGPAVLMGGDVAP